MTAKDKAIELFNKMDMIIYTDQDNWKSQCIRCALIAVDEILNTNTLQDRNCGFVPLCEKHTEYWQEVKQEIKKL
jgi:hypothetical protein